MTAQMSRQNSTMKQQRMLRSLPVIWKSAQLPSGGKGGLSRLQRGTFQQKTGERPVLQLWRCWPACADLGQPLQSTQLWT